MSIEAGIRSDTYLLTQANPYPVRHKPGLTELRPGKKPGGPNLSPSQSESVV